MARLGILHAHLASKVSFPAFLVFFFNLKAFVKTIPPNIYPGALLKLAHFGNATVQKIVVHSVENQIVCNVITDTGERLYLRPDYAATCAEVIE